LPDRPVPFQVDADAILARLGESLPEDPADPAEVVDTLAGAVEPGLLAIPSGRFYGWVMGGTLPAALVADWLTSAWDQTPACASRRRARGVPVWAALRSLGRSGVAALVDRLVENAQALAAGISQIDGTEVLNDVVYTQVCGSFGADSRTEAVARELIADGAVWMSGSRWRDRAVLRISVSNRSTDDQDVATSLDAVPRAVAAVDHK
jgi:hypothetical protein